MNCLQKINKLLENETRTIIFGVPREATENTVISLSIGDSDVCARSLGDKRRTDYVTVEINVYAADYNVGLGVLLSVRDEIENAVKSTVNIFFTNFVQSDYDERLNKHVLKSRYKIIE
jgi:hypothetical protein